MQVLKSFFQCSVDSIPKTEKMENNANVTSTENDIFVHFNISYQTSISDVFFDESYVSFEWNMKHKEWNMTITYILSLTNDNSF